MPEAKPFVLETGDGDYRGSPEPLSIEIDVAGVTATDLNDGLAEIIQTIVDGGITGVAAGTGVAVDSSDPLLPEVSIDVPYFIEVGRTTLVTGAKTVLTANATTGANILVSVQALGTVTAPKPIAVTAISNGVSFTITSSDATDTSVVSWGILSE